jgi:hypothetical protein
LQRLEQFLIGTLLPSVTRASELLRSGEASRLAEARSEVVEAFLWLHLGVEVGAFAEEQSGEIYKQYGLPFFESLLLQEFGEREERPPEYVAHSEESIALLGTLPRYAAILAEKAMRREEIFGEELLEFDNHDSVHGLFQTLLLFYTSFAANPAVRQFTYELNFADDDAWDRDWETGCSAEDVRKADLSGSGSPIAQTFAGYLAFWGYGAKLREAFENAGEGEEVSASDLFRLRTRTWEIQSWRMNLRSGRAVYRLEKIRQKVEEEIGKEAEQPGIDPECAGLIRRSMDEALELWGVGVFVEP